MNRQGWRRGSLVLAGLVLLAGCEGDSGGGESEEGLCADRLQGRRCECRAYAGTRLNGCAGVA